MSRVAVSLALWQKNCFEMIRLQFHTCSRRLIHICMVELAVILSIRVFVYQPEKMYPSTIVVQNHILKTQTWTNYKSIRPSRKLRAQQYFLANVSSSYPITYYHFQKWRRQVPYLKASQTNVCRLFLSLIIKVRIDGRSNASHQGSSSSYTYPCSIVISNSVMVGEPLTKSNGASLECSNAWRNNGVNPTQ